MLAALGSFWTRSKQILFNRLRKILLRFAHDSTGWCCWILKPLPSQNTELKSIVYHFFYFSLIHCWQVTKLYLSTFYSPFIKQMWILLVLAFTPDSLTIFLKGLWPWRHIPSTRVSVRWRAEWPLLHCGSSSGDLWVQKKRRPRGKEGGEIRQKKWMAQQIAVQPSLYGLLQWTKQQAELKILRGIFIVTSFQL